MTKEELKSEITYKIMELRQKECVEADCILDVLDDYLDPFITELEALAEKRKCCGNCKHHTFWEDELRWCTKLSHEDALVCDVTKSNWEEKDD